MAIRLESRGAPADAAARGSGIHLHAVSFSHGPLPVLDAIDLHAEPGETVCVVGPSGCGKTTLLELACGLLTPGHGRIEAPSAVLMPQRDMLLPWLSALDNAALPHRLAGLRRAQARERVRPLFDELGLSGFEQARPYELSGGMRQRVAFLRTLGAGRPLLCLDEPFGALDALTRAQVQDWLVEALAAEPRTVLLVTHDVEEAILLGDRVTVLSPRPGRIRAELEVALPRPRKRTSPEVVALRQRALHALEGERS
jgi:ABC-type nitrate/sulfonate/bicarbonate transport system ATPase subunit